MNIGRPRIRFLFVSMWLTCLLLASPSPSRAGDEAALLVDTTQLPLENKSLIDDTSTDHPHLSRQPIMMWRIMKDGHSAYLTGSVHMGPDDLFPLPAIMTNAFLDAPLAVFEFDPSGIDETFQKNREEIGALPKGQNLRKMLTPEARGKLENALKAISMPAGALDHDRPWLAALKLTFSFTFRSNGTLSMNNGIDRYFLGLAKLNRKPIRGLESTTDQLKFFESLDESLDVEFLEKTLDELLHLESVITRLIAAWKIGDTNELAAIVDESFRDYPAMKEAWLTNRNTAWADSIEKIASDYDGVFITVGAAHLAGPEGLPAILRERGFDVQQVAEETTVGLP